MGWSKHHAMGLIHYDPQHCYPGYTLFTNNSGGFHAYLIDMQGRIATVGTLRRVSRMRICCQTAICCYVHIRHETAEWQTGCQQAQEHCLSWTGRAISFGNTAIP